MIEPPAQLPSYAETLEAYQRSREPDLRAILSSLPLAPGARILDVACGAGAYMRYLADEAPAASIVGVDIDEAYLALATRGVTPESLRFCRADATRLPFAEAAFDLALCVQSFYSLPDPLQMLCEMRRVTRPGGTVAVIENDSLHHMVLPWPADLELAVREAQLRSWREQYGQEEAAKFYAGRHLSSFFCEAGLPAPEITTHTIERSAPLDPEEERFLRNYIADLGERVLPYLRDEQQRQFAALFHPESPQYLFTQDDFHVANLEILAQAIV